jgi:hypothetical protein
VAGGQEGQQGRLVMRGGRLQALKERLGDRAPARLI